MIRFQNPEFNDKSNRPCAPTRPNRHAETNTRQKVLKRRQRGPLWTHSVMEKHSNSHRVYEKPESPAHAPTHIWALGKLRKPRKGLKGSFGRVNSNIEQKIKNLRLGKIASEEKPEQPISHSFNNFKRRVKARSPSKGSDSLRKSGNLNFEKKEKMDKKGEGMDQKRVKLGVSHPALHSQSLVRLPGPPNSKIVEKMPNSLKIAKFQEKVKNKIIETTSKHIEAIDRKKSNIYRKIHQRGKRLFDQIEIHEGEDDSLKLRINSTDRFLRSRSYSRFQKSKKKMMSKLLDYQISKQNSGASKRRPTSFGTSSAPKLLRSHRKRQKKSQNGKKIKLEKSGKKFKFMELKEKEIIYYIENGQFTSKNAQNSQNDNKNSKLRKSSAPRLKSRRNRTQSQRSHKRLTKAALLRLWNNHPHQIPKNLKCDKIVKIEDSGSSGANRGLNKMVGYINRFDQMLKKRKNRRNATNIKTFLEGHKKAYVMYSPETEARRRLRRLDEEAYLTKFKTVFLLSREITSKLKWLGKSCLGDVDKLNDILGHILVGKNTSSYLIQNFLDFKKIENSIITQEKDDRRELVARSYQEAMKKLRKIKRKTDDNFNKKSKVFWNEDGLPTSKMKLFEHYVIAYLLAMVYFGKLNSEDQFSVGFNLISSVLIKTNLASPYEIQAGFESLRIKLNPNITIIKELVYFRDNLKKYFYDKKAETVKRIEKDWKDTLQKISIKSDRDGIVKAGELFGEGGVWVEGGGDSRNSVLDSLFGDFELNSLGELKDVVGRVEEQEQLGVSFEKLAVRTRRMNRRGRAMMLNLRRNVVRERFRKTGKVGVVVDEFSYPQEVVSFRSVN